MAEREGSKEPHLSGKPLTSNGDPKDRKSAITPDDDDDREDEEEEEEEEDDDDDDDEEEPRLKYATVTNRLSSLFRNGDAVSTFLVAGDKMVGIIDADDLARSDRHTDELFVDRWKS